MMRQLSLKLNRKHFFLPIPFVSPQLSKLWVRLITGAPKDLVYPLVDSLKTHMIPISPKPPELNFIAPMSYIESISKSLEMRNLKRNNPSAYSYHGVATDSQVRSVQRVTTLFRSDVKKVSELYFKWLNAFFKNLILVEQVGRFYNVRFFLMKQPLLVFEHAPERSFEGRELYYIRSGLLVSPSKRARLEFRNIYQGLYKIIAIHEYKPSLPWYIYKYTQAIIHLFVMRSFGNYLIHKKL